MKTIRRTIFVLAFLLPLAAANAASSAVYALQVDGLACPFCAYGIEKKLSSIKGVKDIKVDIKKGEVIVTMSEGANLSEQLARDKVEEAGFSLRAFTEQTGDAKP